MKLTVTGETPTQEINWVKPQLLKSKDGEIVLSNGLFGFDTFEGTRLYNGYFDKEWPKKAFTLLPSNIPVTLQND